MDDTRRPCWKNPVDRVHLASRVTFHSKESLSILSFWTPPFVGKTNQISFFQSNSAVRVNAVAGEDARLTPAEQSMLGGQASILLSDLFLDRC